MDELLGLANAQEEETSLVYLKQWDRLVSSTNWEKGKIIHTWRTALVAAGASAAQYSDETWSRRVGHVTGQHVGRLRRVFERFGSVHDTYERLYWSHFQSALDWNDAEMWLEGAVQNGWSVAEMRSSRWLAMGAPDELRPQETDIVAAEIDEDFSARDGAPRDLSDPSARGAAHDGATGPDVDQAPDFGDEPSADYAEGTPFDPQSAEYPGAAHEEPIRPFADLPELPPDLSEAFENFKLSILRHKVAGWSEVSREDVLQSLEALRDFACAPS